MDKIVKLIKKKKKDTASVINQVYTGVRNDWFKLLNALETNKSKSKIPKPGR